ncbi:hypothetical protein NSTC745_02657 [Nostoc sp. DSM 114161]|jgi:hypothetical protein
MLRFAIVQDLRTQIPQPPTNWGATAVGGFPESQASGVALEIPPFLRRAREDRGFSPQSVSPILIAYFRYSGSYIG